MVAPEVLECDLVTCTYTSYVCTPYEILIPNKTNVKVSDSNKMCYMSINNLNAVDVIFIHSCTILS